MPRISCEAHTPTPTTTTPEFLASNTLRPCALSTSRQGSTRKEYRRRKQKPYRVNARVHPLGPGPWSICSLLKMLPGRQRAFALALAVMLAFSIGVYYGRERLYDTVLRLSSPAGRASFQQDGQGSLVVPAAWSSDTSAAPIKRANGAFVILVRNEDLGSILESIQQVELHFNRRCHYPYVFLDDKKFTPHFIETTSVRGTCPFSKLWESNPGAFPSLTSKAGPAPFFRQPSVATLLMVLCRRSSGKNRLGSIRRKPPTRARRWRPTASFMVRSRNPSRVIWKPHRNSLTHLTFGPRLSHRRIRNVSTHVSLPVGLLLQTPPARLVRLLLAHRALRQVLLRHPRRPLRLYGEEQERVWLHHQH